MIQGMQINLPQLVTTCQFCAGDQLDGFGAQTHALQHRQDYSGGESYLTEQS